MSAKLKIATTGEHEGHFEIKDAHRRLKEKLAKHDEAMVVHKDRGLFGGYTLYVDDDGDILIEDHANSRAFYLSSKGYIPNTLPLPAGFIATDEEIDNLKNIETITDIVAVVEDILKGEISFL